MNQHESVVVAGLGVLGATASWILADRGLRVVGLDRFRPPHDRGSTHGATRVIREGIFEGHWYVPMLRRAYDGWSRLEEISGRTLVRPFPALMSGDPDGALMTGTLRTVRTHAIRHRHLDAAGIREAFPGLTPDPRMEGVVEERAGTLNPPACVVAALDQARLAGAEFRFETPLLGWEVEGDEVVVRIPGGELRTDALVLAAGPWLTAVMGPDAYLPLDVVRQVTHRFALPETGAEAGEAPAAHRTITIWEYAPGHYFYTVPEEGALKAAIHYGGQPVDPDRVRRTVDPDEVERVRELLERFLPGAAGPHLDSTVCLYTNTQDHHFAAGPFPGDPKGPAAGRVFVLGGGSGHAFKFAPALADFITDLVQDRKTFLDPRPFAPDRFRGFR
jgi:sarcosine oxidase